MFFGSTMWPTIEYCWRSLICNMTFIQSLFNSLRPRQNGCHFADDIVKCIFMKEKCCILIQIHWNLFLMVQSTKSQHWFRYRVSDITWVILNIHLCIFLIFNHVGSLLIFSSTTTRGVWIIPSFQIWGYVLQVELASCVITNCSQHRWVIPSPLSIALWALLEENITRKLFPYLKTCSAKFCSSKLLSLMPRLTRLLCLLCLHLWCNGFPDMCPCTILIDTLIARFMGPIWGRQVPGGPHVGPMNLAIWAPAQPYHRHLTPGQYYPHEYSSSQSFLMGGMIS